MNKVHKNLVQVLIEEPVNIARVTRHIVCTYYLMADFITCATTATVKSINLLVNWAEQQLRHVGYLFHI